MDWLRKLKEQAKLHQRLILTVLPILLYIVRAWPYIRHPQLFAEDGREWMAQAHNHTAHALFTPYAGLLHTFERVWSTVLSVLPLAAEPLAYNLTALAIFALLCFYLFSKRTNFFRSSYQMIFVSISLSLAVNIEDFYFNFSNSVFMLGIISACIIVAKRSHSRIITTLETALFALMCFTLPFAWIFIPMLAARWYFEHKRQYTYLALALIGGITQAIVHHLYNNRPGTISFIDLRSRYALLVIYNQMIIPALRFCRIDIDPATVHRPSVSLLIILSFFICVGLTAFAFWRANTRLRYLIVFFIGMTVAALSNPQITAATARQGYSLLAVTIGGSRYWVFGIFLLFIVFALCSEVIINRKYRYYVMVAFFSIGFLSAIQDHKFFIVKNNFSDYSRIYSQDARKINQPGPPLNIPENPGVGWTIVLDRPQTH